MRSWNRVLQIKVGQFKDGLDMSAIREVKFLRELSHPNVIQVRTLSLPFLPYSLSTFTDGVSLRASSWSTSSQTNQT